MRKLFQAVKKYFLIVQNSPPFSHIFGEAQESVLELVAKTLASIRTGALLVAALLRRHVPVPSVVLCDFALCFQKLQRHPQHCCRQH